MAACSSCEAPVKWAITEAGKLMPLDPDPVDDGTFIIVGTGQSKYGSAPKIRAVIEGEQALPGMGDEPPRYKPHWATCPNADSHRRS